MLLATTHEVARRYDGRPGGAEVYRVGVPGGRRSTIEAGDTFSPTVVTTADRIAAAYTFKNELHFALLDGELERLGDVLTVAPTNAAPALTFDGTAARVFWALDQGGKTRLMSASYKIGDAAFSTPEVATTEALTQRAPVAARLPNGGWVVAWAASSGAGATLRMTLLGATGALATASEVAKAGAVDGLVATSTDKGVSIVWADGATAFVARVSCAATP